MPIISIKLAKGRSVDQKRELAQAVTDAVAEKLDVKREWVTVLFEEYDRQNWATGGELHSDKFGEGFGRQGTGEADSGRK